MKTTPLQRWINVIALLVTIVINALANILPLNGQNTGAISDRFPVKFVPAGYVFSIWGVIYLALLAFAVYQILPSQRDNPNIERIGWLFALSCVFNSVWIFLWHYNQFLLTVVIMLGLLATLIATYQRLEIGRRSVARSDGWLIHVPFSIYLGWVTVATIANITTVLYEQGWRGGPLSEATWAVLLLVIGVALTALITLRRRDVAYGLVIVWAFIGIAVKQADAPSVAIAAGVAAAAVVLLIIASYFRSRPRLQPRLT